MPFLSFPFLALPLSPSRLGWSLYHTVVLCKFSALTPRLVIRVKFRNPSRILPRIFQFFTAFDIDRKLNRTPITINLKGARRGMDGARSVGRGKGKWKQQQQKQLGGDPLRRFQRAVRRSRRWTRIVDTESTSRNVWTYVVEEERGGQRGG